MTVEGAGAPSTGGAPVRFRLADRSRRYREVHLDVSGRVAGATQFRWERGAWILDLPAPDAVRLEYVLAARRADGGWEHLCDPDNPRRAPGPFGERSVLEPPGYEPPAWLTETAPAGEQQRASLPSPVLRADVPAVLWTAAGARPRDPLPLLVVHDGPEYADYSQLVRYLDWAVSAGRLPACHAALLGPVDRDQTYSASSVYAAALAADVVPRLDDLLPGAAGSPRRLGMGASLGALAMLHSHRLYPGMWQGLFLQSGSYFQPHTDPHEAGFVRFGRITRFVRQVLRSRAWADPVPVTLTCGTVEENLACNRAMATALERQGYDARLAEHGDGHTWVGWRDALHPRLADLCRRVWQ